MLGSISSPPTTLGPSLTGGAVWRRTLAASALFSLLLGLALALALSPDSTHNGFQLRPALRAGALSHDGWSRLPLAAQGTISSTLGASDPAFRARASHDGYRATNPSQGLSMRFGRSGVEVGSGAVRLTLSLRAVGYGASLLGMGDVSPQANGNRIVYTRTGLEEWYANGPLGLEQGFTVTRAQSSRLAGPLTLSLAFSGAGHASLAGDRRSLTLSAAGHRSLRYTGLSSIDARGRNLPSWLELHAGRLLLRVDTRGARYPLRIDPFIQQGPTLTGGGESGPGQFGWSVALSGDGNTALIGGPRDHGNTGAAWVFARSGTTWSQQSPKLTANDEIGAAQFGFSVALSSDGNTALVGGPGDTSAGGAAWAFTRSGATWSQQGPKLTAAGISGSFGFSVSLSADGNTALAGVVQSDLSAGAIVFVRSAAAWKQLASLTSGSPGSGGGVDGVSTTLSADGATALIGGNQNNLSGAVWVYTRSGTTWSQQAGPLTGGGESGPGQFGLSGLALSANGDTALIGGANDNGGTGAAWVFTRSGSNWSQQGGKLTPSPNGLGQFGYTVSLSADGGTALIGAPQTLSGVNPAAGAAWVFTRSQSTWSQRQMLSGGTSEGLGFGHGVSLSADGATALVGGTSGEVASSGIGAGWIFVNRGSATLSALRVIPAHFRAVRGSSPRPVATVRYSDSEAATATLRILRRRGARLVTVGSLTHHDVAGVNRVHLSGRLNGRPLPPGSYEIRATATFNGRKSSPVRASFSIVR